MNARKLALDAAALALGVVLALTLAEVGLRLLLPETALLSPRQNAYWLHLLQRRSPGEPSNADMVSDPRLGWRMRSSYRAPGVTHDPMGFRGSRPPSAQPTRMRILAIGDSFTYGLGVRDEETFGAVLEQATGAELINAGVNGYGVDQAVLMWEERGRPLAPHVVVLGYYVDDFFRNGLAVRDWPKPQFVRQAATGHHDLYLPAESLRRLVRDSAAGPGRWRLGLAFALVWQKVLHRLGRVDEGGLQPLAETSHFLLTRLNDSVKASGARLVVAFIGHVHQDVPELRWIEAAVLRSCRELDIECIDFAAPGMTGAEHFGANAHWSAVGHRFAAAELGRLLRLSSMP